MNLNMKKLPLLLAYLVIPLLCTLLVFLSIRSRLASPINRDDTALEILEVPSSQTFKQLAKNLEEKGFIRSAKLLSLAARLKGMDKSITAGEYELSRSMTPLEILAKLAGGKVYQRKVTFPEGISTKEMGALLEKAGVITKREFDAAVVDSKLLMKAGIPSDSFEGYLFPDTYLFSRPITPEAVIWKMLELGEAKWKPEFTLKAEYLRMDRHQILTLASIVEKETGDREEQSLISSVFFNRIKQSMKLQSDPTVIYGIANFDGNLTREHLETDTPYNTYTRKGLPPGPICNPGERAIRATLYPETTSYLYFVANGRGGHVFSSSLAEHNRNVNLYQRGGAIKSGQINGLSSADLLSGTNIK